MIEIIEKVFDPIRLSVWNGEGIGIGDIISLYYDKNNVYCILSNSKNPFGMVVGESDQWGLISVLCSTAILKTNCYDVLENYEVGDFLYSDDHGLLTKSKCDENAILVGRVLDPPIDYDSPMEINWI